MRRVLVIPPPCDVEIHVPAHQWESWRRNVRPLIVIAKFALLLDLVIVLFLVFEALAKALP